MCSFMRNIVNSSSLHIYVNTIQIKMHNWAVSHPSEYHSLIQLQWETLAAHSVLPKLLVSNPCIGLCHEVLKKESAASTNVSFYHLPILEGLVELDYDVIHPEWYFGSRLSFWGQLCEKWLLCRHLWFYLIHLSVGACFLEGSRCTFYEQSNLYTLSLVEINWIFAIDW